MEDSAEWRTAHRGLSEIDLRFREMAKSSPDFLNRSCFQGLEQNKDLLKYPLQPWITFLGRDKLAELKRVSLGTSRLIRNLRERIFGDDWARLAEFYRLGSPLVAEILFSSPSGAETAISRCDFIDTASGFKCIEFNCTPNLGGWEISIITRMHLSIPATASFIAREEIPVTFTDPILTMFRHIFADLRAKQIASEGEVTIGFIVEPGQEAPENHPRIQFFQGEMNRAIQALGLDISGKIVNCSYPSMALRERSLFLGNRKIDALMELVRVNTPPAIYRLFKGNCIGLYNGPIERILGTKRNLALLSQNAASGRFSDAERAFVEAHIPWTRLVSPEAVEYEGETRQLSDLAVARQDRFVLKKGESVGGKDVLMGRTAHPEEWRQALDTAMAKGDWVVQEIQESLSYLYQSGAYGCSVHDMIWGPFVVGDAYGGLVLRMQPKAGGGAVNLSLKATEGVVLEV
jgi:hypothetical protein